MTGFKPDVSLRCSVCAQVFRVTLGRTKCDCGGVLDLTFADRPFGDDFWQRRPGLARYHEALAVEPTLLAVASLDAPPTPLVELGSGQFVKCDYVSPSGSFKDRGQQVLVAVAVALGATRVVIDSSGNSGAACAAHCAKVDMPCTVVVPDHAPMNKLQQSLGYGATVESAPGGRAGATALAATLVDVPGTFYASHSENPFFLEGTKAWAFELWEQLGDAPAEVVISVGSGTLFLGAYEGFRYLLRHGFTTRIPRMVAVQAQGWAPLVGDLNHGDQKPLADGIAIEHPRRRAQIEAAIAATGGEVRVVTNDEITAATQWLRLRGIWVEPTCGAAWAGSTRVAPRGDGPVVVSMGGAGFKTGQ
jgi:threonine synthase